MATPANTSSPSVFDIVGIESQCQTGEFAFKKRLKPYFPEEHCYYSDESGTIIAAPTNQGTLLHSPIKSKPTESYFLRNRDLILSSFEKELTLSKADDLIIEEAKAFILPFANLFAELPFEKCSVEITRSASLKLSLLFSNSRLLIVSKPFTALEDVSENEIIFSLFTNKVLTASDVLDQQEFVEGFKEFLHM